MISSITARTFASLLCILLASYAIDGNGGELDVEVSATKGCKDNVTPPAPRTRAASNARKLLPPVKGIYAGLYAIGEMQENYSRFIEKTGSSPVLVYTFHDFTGPDRGNSSDPYIQDFTDSLEGERPLAVLDYAQELEKKGTVLAVTWAIDCCDFESLFFWFRLKDPNDIVPRLLNGDFDARIRHAARQIKAFDKPIMLSLFGEFNQQGPYLFGKSGKDWMTGVENICNEYGDPGWPDGPERIRDVHIHVIDLFRDEGVRNVTWFMYAGSSYMDPDNEDFSKWMHPKYFYPGDAYMDWVGQSMYFIDPDDRPDVNSDVQNAYTALEPGYQAWGTVTQRPMFLPEFGAPGDGEKSRAKILRHVWNDVLPRLPRVKAFTFADSELFERYFQLPRLGSLPDEIPAWKESIKENPYYIHKPRFR